MCHFLGILLKKLSLCQSYLDTFQTKTHNEFVFSTFDLTNFAVFPDSVWASHDGGVDPVLAACQHEEGQYKLPFQIKYLSTAFLTWNTAHSLRHIILSHKGCNSPYATADLQL